MRRIGRPGAITSSPLAAAANRYHQSGKILTANPAPSTAYSGVGKVKNAGVPLVAINTTAGTAAEMTSNAVIIDAGRQVKEGDYRSEYHPGYCGG